MEGLKCFLCGKRNAYLLVKWIAPKRICRACYDKKKHKPANRLSRKSLTPVRNTRTSSLKRKAAYTAPEIPNAVIKPVAEEPKSAPQNGCKHHWEIETATAQVSKGVCKLCGEKRDFPNYLRDCLRKTSPEPGEYLDPLSRIWLQEFNKTDKENTTIVGRRNNGSHEAY